MDVIGLAPLKVGSLVWQQEPGALWLTVVCKATYVLRPGECTLAHLQEHPADEDRHWDDDPARSLRCPRDLVPVKPGADVILVGSAFAPDRRPARTLDARQTARALTWMNERFLYRAASANDPAEASAVALVLGGVWLAALYGGGR